MDYLEVVVNFAAQKAAGFYAEDRLELAEIMNRSNVVEDLFGREKVDRVLG